MTRPLRLEYAGAVYEIISRGNEDKPIFFDDRDRQEFLSDLHLVQSRYRAIIYAYVLMDNHYHLLIETPQPNLSRIMHDLNSQYTIYFNNRHERTGHLFQGRYKSFIIDKDEYLLKMSRYIHLNPYRNGLTKKPEEYSYSSLVHYLIENNSPSWLNKAAVQAQLAKIKGPDCSYRDYVYEGIKDGDYYQPQVYANTIIGSKDFIERIRQHLLNEGKLSKEISGAKYFQNGRDLKYMAQQVVQYYQVPADILSKPKLKNNNAKKLFVYLSRKYTDKSLSEIKEFLQNRISEVAISKLFHRTAHELEGNKQLRNDIDKIEHILFSDNPTHPLNHEGER